MDDTLLELVPTKKQIKTAKERESEMTALFVERYGRSHLNNSILEGEGMLAGLVGEELYRDYYGFLRSAGEAIFHYDVLDPDVLGRIEVKTKRCTSAPKPHYNCSIAASNCNQQCDYYAFVRVMKDFSRAWILGMMPKDQFFNHRDVQFFNKGDKDPAGFAGWRFKWACFNLPISALLPAPLVTRDFDQYALQPATHSDFTPDVIVSKKERSK